MRRFPRKFSLRSLIVVLTASAIVAFASLKVHEFATAVSPATNPSYYYSPGPGSAADY